MSKQKIANLVGTVELIGREADVQKIYKDLTLTARNKVNKRTGKPYTAFEAPEMGEGRKSNGTKTKKLAFKFTRNQVLGNQEQSFHNHVDRSIQRSNAEVELKLVDVVRTEV